MPDADHELANLPDAELVDLAALILHSRKAVKRFLHARGLTAGAQGVVEAERYLRGRADWPTISAAADKLHARRPTAETPVRFDPRAELVHLLDQRGMNTAADRVDLARRAGVNAGLLEAMLDGADVPLSVATHLLRAAGATRIEFAPIELRR